MDQGDAILTALVWTLHRAGASGVVSRDLPTDGLHLHLRRVARGEIVVHLSGTPEFPAHRQVASSRPSLTSREEEVLRLVAAGKGHAEIARFLHVAPKTVSNHLTSIRAKLGLRSREGLLAWAVRLGLL